MARKRASEAPAHKRRLYQRLVATHKAVTIRGNRRPYTAVGGHRFSFLTDDGTLALRLPAEARAAFERKFRPDACVLDGAVMPEYVLVPDHVFAATREAKKFFDLSYAYVASFPPLAFAGGAERRSTPHVIEIELGK